MTRLTTLLFRYRWLLVTMTGGFILYVNFFMWLYVPFTWYQYIWQPDSQALIVDVIPGGPPDTIQVGDIITAVNGRPLIRNRLIYSLPTAGDHTLAVIRGDEMLTIQEPLSPMHEEGIAYRLPAGILALSGWLLGSLVLVLAWQDEETEQVLRIGLVFISSAVAVIGIQGALLGVPAAWIGHPFAFFTGVGFIYLGLVPRQAPLARWQHRLLQLLLLTAVLLALLYTYETAVLFPQRTSFQEQWGISLYGLSLGLPSLALLMLIATIAYRALKLPDSYNRQQIRVLLFFLAQGILPSVLLTLLPRVLLDTFLLTFPVAIALMAFIPAGYFYVVYRRGILGLDHFFTRIVSLTLITLLILLIYLAGVTVIRNQFLVPFDVTWPNIVMLLPTMGFAFYARSPINHLVDAALFGEPSKLDPLPLMINSLVQQPDIASILHTTQKIMTAWGIQQFVLILEQNEAYLDLVTRQTATTPIVPFAAPFVRSALKRTGQPPPPLFATHDWLELLLPIQTNQQFVGIMGVSLPATGFYNAQQVETLQQVANVIGLGYEMVSLFTAMRHLSQQTLQAQEAERKRLAGDIHESSLQKMGGILIQLQTISRTGQPQLVQTAKQMEQAVNDLRQKLAGLYPPIIDQGLPFILRELKHQFQEKQGLFVHINLADEFPERVTEKTLPTLTAVYYVVLEALNNVVKHAGVNQVHIIVTKQEGDIRLTVSDTGPGCNPGLLTSSTLIRTHHFGLMNMLNRAESAGGTLHLEANEPHGTKVIMIVPWSATGKVHP